MNTLRLLIFIVASGSFLKILSWYPDSSGQHQPSIRIIVMISSIPTHPNNALDTIHKDDLISITRTFNTLHASIPIIALASAWAIHRYTHCPLYATITTHILGGIGTVMLCNYIQRQKYIDALQRALERQPA